MIVLVFIGGILPTLFWLFYWLHEDNKNPEPKHLILLTFILGMVVVPIAGYIERYISIWFVKDPNIQPSEIFYKTYFIAITILILWAAVEEVLKYLAAYFGGLNNKANNEAIDPIIYMITAALGFASFENILYIFKEINNVGYLSSSVVLTGNFRFIGSTLLHTASSAFVGIFLAFSYYKNWTVRGMSLIFGLICATALHTIFNSFIIRQENFTLIGFSIVWLSIIAIILLFEKVKKIKK
jgi:protease PrsW